MSAGTMQRRGKVSDLFGVVVGFALGLVAAGARDFWLWWFRRKHIRQLISIENEENLALLRALWQDATHPRPLGYTPKEQILLLSDNLARLCTRKWRREIWEAHLSNITTLFDPPQVQRLREFHQGMKRISEIQTELRELIEADIAWSEEHDGEPDPRGRHHNDERFQDLWYEYQGLYEWFYRNTEDLLFLPKRKRIIGSYARLETPPY